MQKNKKLSQLVLNIDNFVLEFSLILKLFFDNYGNIYRLKAINIYTYSRIQENMATELENILSQRPKKLNVKVQEFVAIKTLVDLLRNMETEIKYFENLFTSFTIEQIGKEFDLIKIDRDRLVLNIKK